jgi:type VI secretion system secreted protein VgrG
VTSPFVAFACAKLGPSTVLSLEGREAMDARADLFLRASVEGDVDLDALVLAPATLRFVDPEEGAERAVAVLVVEASIEGGRDRVVALRLSDPLFPLSLRGGYRVFQESTAEAIATRMLVDAGVPAEAIAPRLAGQYPERPMAVQYGEADLDFVTRMLADDGISFWIETANDGAWRVMLGDGTGAHQGIEGSTTLPFTGPGGARAPGIRGFSMLAWEQGLAHDRAMVREYDPDHPDVYLDGTAGEGALVHFEYPATVPDVRAAELLARRRLEQLRRDEVVVTGESDCMRLAPGRLLAVAGGGFDAFEQRMLITEVRHRYARPLAEGGQGSPYRNEVVLRPTHGDGGEARPPYRPALQEGPRLEHVESAVVTGPAGEEIHVDSLGRVKLRFLWDRSGITDDRSSTWSRCLTPPLASAMLLPRVGWEVAVGYLDGLPERPAVLGRLYNGTAVPPDPLPAGKATTSLQSWVTPKGSATQGMRFGDDAGEELFFLAAARDLTATVGGAYEALIDGDETHAVGLSLSMQTLGAREETVGGDQAIDVGEPIVIGVAGINKEIVGGAEIIGVGGNRALVAGGGCTEILGGAYALQCNQSNTKTTGVFTRVVGGAHVISSGLGLTENVAGARAEVCLGSRVIQCAGTYTESIQGGKRSQAGAVKHKAGGNLGTAAPTGKVTSGEATLRAGAGLSITAPSITIEAASISAGKLGLRGGALHVESGTLLLDGDVHHEGGGEAGS